MVLRHSSDQVKLELHRVVVEYLLLDEARTRTIALKNTTSLRASYQDAGWGLSGLRWIDEWERLLHGPLEDIIAVCQGEDEYSIDMRQVSPFAGVITQGERLEAIRLAHRRVHGTSTKDDT